MNVMILGGIVILVCCGLVSCCVDGPQTCCQATRELTSSQELTTVASDSSCQTCRGKGFCHTSTLDHNALPERRCQFCTTCMRCAGTGAVATTVTSHLSRAAPQLPVVQQMAPTATQRRSYDQSAATQLLHSGPILCMGDRVRIQGLTSEGGLTLNGKYGKIVDIEGLRYHVQIAGADTKAFKAENLQPMTLP